MVPHPTNMATPHTPHVVILSVLSVVVVAMLVYAYREYRVTGRLTMLLMLVGGLVCSLNEPLADVAGDCWFPTDGFMAQTLFGRSIPVWVVLAYVIFFGALEYILMRELRKGRTRQQIWIGIGVFWILNLLLELPLLGSDLYVYYGPQALKIGGFPLIWITINSLGAFAGAVTALRLETVLRGPSRLLLVLVPFATYMASWTVSMPGFWSLQADTTMAVRTVFALVSIAAAIWAIDTLIRIGLAISAHENRTETAERLPAAA